ncbi:hypothetical protein V6N13_096076 [Hibiscus sabdariffa]
MGHPARECGIKDEMYKKSGQYGPWLRASSFKKSTTQSASQRSSPVAGALDGNPKNPRRHVDPFGKRIIPSFTSSPSLSLTEIDDIQCDEDAKFSLSA